VPLWEDFEARNLTLEGVDSDAETFFQRASVGLNLVEACAYTSRGIGEMSALDIEGFFNLPSSPFVVSWVEVLNLPVDLLAPALVQGIAKMAVVTIGA